jgi:hypothetical protein
VIKDALDARLLLELRFDEPIDVLLLGMKWTKQILTIGSVRVHESTKRIRQGR